MTISIWGNAALASLLASTPASTGQRVQVMFVPLSSSSSSSSSSSILATGHPAPPSSSATIPRMDPPFPFVGTGGFAAEGAEEEPPCRRRRLAPWRERVRERCRAEAEARGCVGPPPAEDDPTTMEARDLRRREWRTGGGDVPPPPPLPSSSSSSSLGRDVDAFLEVVESLFAAPPPLPPRFPPSGGVRASAPSPPGDSSPRRAPGVAADPFDEILGDMLDFSLRAFDQVMGEAAAAAAASDPAASPREEGSSWSEDAVFGEGEDVWIEDSLDDYLPKEEHGEEVAVSPPKEAMPPAGEGEDGAEDDVASSWSEDAVVAAPPSYKSSEDAVEPNGDAASLTPAQAAEHALDVMVASLARSAASGSRDGGDEDGEGEEGTVPEEEAGLPSIHNLPERLFRMGQDLLAETSARRRLSEGGEAGEAADPRLRVKERLARRLTEYRTSLVYSPSANSITMYTAPSGGGPPDRWPVRSLLAPASPFPLFAGMMPPFPPSRALPPLGMGDRGVDECLRSRFDAGDLEGTACHAAVGELLLAVDHGSPGSPHHREFSRSHRAFAHPSPMTASEPRGCPSVLLVGLCTFAIAAWLFGVCSGAAEEEGDYDDDDEGDFDYVGLPEDDAEEAGVLPASGEGGAGVYAGVPVQVV